MSAAETYAAIAGQAALYGRSAADRIDELVEAGDALTAALQTLRTDPTADGAEHVGQQLHGMQRSCGELLAALLREARRVDS